MKTKLFVALALVLVAATAFGAAGQVIRSFSLGLAVRGLAYDYSDNTVWAASASTYNCQINQ